VYRSQGYNSGSLQDRDIPQYQTVPTFSRKLRFRNTNTDATADVPLLIGDLLAAIGVNSATSTTGYTIAKAVKVRRITIWGAPKSDSAGDYSEAMIDWHSSSGFSSGNKKEDVSISNAKPCYVTSKPPRGSLCEFWCENGSVEYCTIRMPLGGIIDVDISFKFAEAQTALITSIFSPGFLYYGKLDFTNNALIVPLGLESFG